MTRSRILTVVLSSVLLLAVLSVAQSVLNSVNLPGNHQGYEPVQPMPYSHRLHAGELGIDCRYCHFGAEQSRDAGVPAMNVCMNCHQFVTAPVAELRAEDARAEREKRAPARVISPRLRPLYDALALDDQLRPLPGRVPRAIEWIRVHDLPDYVYFDHRPHVSAGLDCQDCHGQVQTMERVRQVEDLSMGWCVNCHRDANETGVRGRAVKAPVDCTGCHY
jgi:hypothetical protein